MTASWLDERGTEQDWRGILDASAEELRWLCYTLTGDETLSDAALDAALQQSLKGAGQVFREWMLSWARRLIIKFCIVTVRPAGSYLAERDLTLIPTTVLAGTADLKRVLTQPSPLLQQKLLRLDNLSRFVFVLRAIEGYSRRDTALLLNIDDRLCEWALVHATRALASNLVLVGPESTAAVLACA